MNHNCDIYRQQVLERLGSSAVESTACATCAAWQTQQDRLVGELAALTRLAAPARLSDRLTAELALRELPARSAPQALDMCMERLAARVAEECVSERALRALDAVPTPPVLDRLVAEELAAGGRVQVRRFAGDLPRQAAPASLSHRLRQPSSVRGPKRLRRVAAAAASLAAALALFVGLSSDAKPSRPTYRFDIVEAASLEEFSPFARGIVSAASRGALTSASHSSTATRPRRDG